MSYDAPPPPPPSTPPPPPSAGGPSGPGFDPKTINPYDWAILGIGVLLFIFSFFSYWTAKASYGGVSISASTGGWHFSDLTFFSWFAFLFGFLAAVVVALALFVPTVKLPAPTYIASLGLFALSFVLYLIGSFAAGPDVSGAGFSFGPGFSQILSIILVFAGIVLTIMRAQQTGAALPGPLAKLPKIGK